MTSPPCLRRSYVRRYIEKSPQSWGGLVEGNGRARKGARPNDTTVRMKYGIVFGLASSVGGRGGGGRAVAPERQVVSSRARADVYSTSSAEWGEDGRGERDNLILAFLSFFRDCGTREHL